MGNNHAWRPVDPQMRLSDGFQNNNGRCAPWVQTHATTIFLATSSESYQSSMTTLIGAWLECTPSERSSLSNRSAVSSSPCSASTTPADPSPPLRDAREESFAMPSALDFDFLSFFTLAGDKSDSLLLLDLLFPVLPSRLALEESLLRVVPPC